MKLYRAETGKRVLIPQLRPNDGLDTLRLAIEKATRIPQGSQILMTSMGLQLKPDMMFEAITSTGKDEYTIMVYNREVLTTDISSSILTLADQAKAEPIIPPLASSLVQSIPIPSSPNSPTTNRDWGSQYQRTFDTYVAHIMAYYKAVVAHAGICERIMEELRMQSLAVQVALTNLDAHSRSVLETFEKFNVFATKEFTKQARLLQSFPRDIEALRQIRVHPALLPADTPERFISDFIPTDKLVLWAERCREIHEGLMKDGKDLSRSMKDVQEGTVTIRTNSGINLEQLEDAMNEILQTVEQQSQLRHRVERDQTRVKERLVEIAKPAGLASSGSTLESLGQLANVYVTDYIDSSQHADEMLREKLGIFISAKRSQTANLISQLMHISKLQSTIASIPPSLGALDDSLRKRDADFSQLVYVQRIPIAYGALVVEIVRRREYSKLLLSKSQQLAEVMSRFRQMEQRRRDSFRSEVAKFVPVVVPGLDDVPPYCEINALNTRDRLPPFTREHVAEFERLVNQLSIGLSGQDASHNSTSRVLGGQESNTGASSISSAQETQQDAMSKLRVTLVKMTAQMDVMGGEFDRILEKSFYTERIQRLEEENARLRADMSRADVQQRSATPQLSQSPFPRLQTPVGGSSASTTTVGGATSSNAPTSPKLTRQPSRGSTAAAIVPTDDQQQQILHQQIQQNQKLSKENVELSTKIKAYETRIRSLEETLYQNFRAGSSVDSSLSSKDSRQQSISSGSEPWKSPEDIQTARSLSQAKELERKRDEERLLCLEKEMKEASLKLEEAEKKLHDQYTANQQAMATNDELRQELLEFKLQSAALEDTTDAQAFDVVASQKRSDELEEELKGMALKYEHLLQHHEKEKDAAALEAQAFRERISELANQIAIEKEILEGQLEQAKREAEEATERATEHKYELDVVNEDLQDKVLELEEKLESLAAEHKDVTARAQQLEGQLDSHRAVHTDIVAQLKDQEQRTIAAQQAEEKVRAEYSVLHEGHVQVEKDQSALEDVLKATKENRDELAQQVESLEKQIADLEAQREAYKMDVNLRLEEAKSMVKRAEEDWKEKSRLLEQTEKAIKSLNMPIQSCFTALGQENSQSELTGLEQVGATLQLIGEGIGALTKKFQAEATEAKILHNQQLSSLNHDHETSRDILNATIATLKQASKNAQEQSVATIREREATLEGLRDELDRIKVLQRASSIPVPLSTTPVSETPLATASPLTPMPPSLPSTGRLTRLLQTPEEPFSQQDRILLGTLALELGIPLPLLSEQDESKDLMSPTSSVLLDNSEKRHKSGSTMLTHTPVPTGSSSTIIAASSSASRSSSTTVPLPTDGLQTFDFTDLDVAKATSLIKKKLFDTEHLLKRWQRECKSLKEKYGRASAEAHEKIAFRNFKVDDLTLFLPTRNSVSKPWAAFNINFPHYFLQMTPTMANQLRNREWIVARITSITEAIVDKRLGGAEVEEGNVISANNPFGLADGVKYYLLEATSWNGYHSSSHGHGRSSSSSHGSSAAGSSSKLRHHASTSALGESPSSSRRELERVKERKERDVDADRRRRRDRDDGWGEDSSVAESTSMDVKAKSIPRSRDAPTSVTETSANHPSMLSLLQTAKTVNHGQGDGQSTLATTTATVTTSVSSASSVGTVGKLPEEMSKASASLQQTQSQILKQRKQAEARLSAQMDSGSLQSLSSQEHPGSLSIESTSGSHASTAPLPGSGSLGSTPAGHRSSIGSSSTLPISIPYQSAATNALRAISSSVGSTGSGGSGSISSLLSHQLGGGGGSGSGTGAAVAASSPPRTMLLSSSPHKTSVSTVSAMGTTVGVNSGTTGSHPGSHPNAGSHGHSHGHSQGTGVSSSPGLVSSAVFSSSSVPTHPSRLSTSSNREDLEQLALFATDEDQDWDRKEEQRQKERLERIAVTRTSSSTSTWHGHPAYDDK